MTTNSLLEEASAAVIRILANSSSISSSSSIMSDLHDGHDHDTGNNFDNNGKPWMEIIMASILVDMATLCAVVVILCTVTIPRLNKERRMRQQQKLAKKRKNRRNPNTENNALVTADNCNDGNEEHSTNITNGALIRNTAFITDLVIPSFACGALLATAVFLLIPGSLHLLNMIDFHDDDVHRNRHRLLQEHDSHDGDGEVENKAMWKFGASLLGGYILNIVLGILFPSPHYIHNMDDEPCPICAQAERTLAEQLILSRNSNLSIGANGANAPAADTTAAAAGGFVENEPLVAIEEEDQEDKNKEKAESDDNGSKQHAINQRYSFSKSKSEATMIGTNLSDEFDDDRNSYDSSLQDTSNANTKDNSKANDSSDRKPAAVKKNDSCLTTTTSRSAPLTKTKNENNSDSNNKQINFSLAASILIGDFCHNITDGILIGNAFKFCSHSLAYTMSATVIYHEIAQELGDFYLLTNHCNLTIWQALITNFISGLSVLLGAVLFVALDDRVNGNETTAVLLAVSAGVHIYIGATECIPRVDTFLSRTTSSSSGIQGHNNNKIGEDHKRRLERRRTLYYQLVSILFFILGAVPIGLVLIYHSHGCDDRT